MATGAHGFVGRHLVRRLVALGADIHLTQRVAGGAPPTEGLSRTVDWYRSHGRSPSGSSPPQGPPVHQTRVGVTR